jgi:dipeptide/tripeptide permease
MTTGDYALHGQSSSMKYPMCIIFILLTEMCERFAFYGFTGSQVCFFKTLDFSSNMASELTSLFGAIVYLTPVLGAYVADVYLGRYNTIAVFCALYIIGLLLTTAGAWPTHGDHAMPHNLALTMAMVGLFLFVSLGAGGIKSNVVVLGADQFKLPEQAKQQESYFNFFYWCINIGATVAFLFLTNVAISGLGDFIPARFGFFASFAIPCAPTPPTHPHPLPSPCTPRDGHRAR